MVASWPNQDQQFAVRLLAALLEQAGKTNIDPRAISDKIYQPIIDRFHAWLTDQDKKRHQDCLNSPDPGGAQGFVLKLAKGLHRMDDPCVSWFADEYSHGPSELRSLERRLRLNRLGSNGDESPAVVVYWDAFELRKKTDPFLLGQEYMAGVLIAGLVERVPSAGPLEYAPAGGMKAAAPGAGGVEAPPVSPAASSTIRAAPPPPPGRPPVRTIEASPPPVRTAAPTEMPAPNRSAPGATVRPPPAATNVPVSEGEVVASYNRDPSSIRQNASSKWHQSRWEQPGAVPGGGGEGPAPIAFRNPDGTIEVNVEAWLASPRAYIGVKLRPGASPPPWNDEPPPSSAAPPRATATPRTNDPGTADTGKAPVPAKPKSGVPTGAASDESRQPMAPAPRRGGRTMPRDPPQAASPDVVTRLGPRARYSADHQHHQQAWELLGGRGTAPPAFYSEGTAYLDPSRWPPP